MSSHAISLEFTYSRPVVGSNAGPPHSHTPRLVVLPETALPLFLHEIPESYLDGLAAQARANHGDALAAAVAAPPVRLSTPMFSSPIFAPLAAKELPVRLPPPELLLIMTFVPFPSAPAPVEVC